MHNLSVNKNTRLVRPITIVMTLGAILTLLFFLHSNDQVFAPDTQQPDAVSAQYTELILQQKPDNDALRLSLIDLYLSLAQFAQAQRHIQLLHNVEPDLLAFYQFKTDAQHALGLSEEHAYPGLRTDLSQLNFAELTSAQQEQLADLALQLNVAPIAAKIYEHLAQTHTEPQQLAYLDLAALWYFAGDQHYKSAQLHSLLAEKTIGQQRIDYQRRVVADYLAANDPAAAVMYLRNILERAEQPLSNEQLTEAVTVALLAQDLPQALYFNTTLIAQDPDNVAARFADLELSLSAGDIQHAWELRDWLLEHQPNDVNVYIKMAELGEWNGAFAEALTLWIQALELQHTPEHFEHAWRLSSQIFDFERGLQLLEDMSEQRQLTDLEIKSVFYAHESRGTPDQVEQWLREYVQRYPSHRLGWTHLLFSLENTAQFSEEGQVLAAMAQHFELTPQERMRWAETYVFTYDLDGAWAVLNQENDANITLPEYWRLKAAIAWELEDDEQVLLAFQQLENNQVPFYRAELDQLIGLYSQTQPEKALELTLQRWRKWQQEQDLMSAVMLTIELNQWDALQALVHEAQQSVKFAQSPPVLLAQASMAWQQLDHALAEQRMLQALEMYPQNHLFRERLLWLYVETHQRESVKKLLSQWYGLAENDDRFWLVFAAANQLLNRGPESLAWYQRYLTLNPSDVLVKAAFADALEAAEYFDAALIQRRALLDMPLPDRATLVQYRTWLNLLAANYGQKSAQAQALAWQDGTPSLLQLWFEQQLILLSQPLQDQQKTAWLTWAQQHNLVISDFEQVEEALRTLNLSELQRLLVNQRLPKEAQVAALKGLNYRHRAGALALTELGDEHAIGSQQQLRNQALEELKVYPQGVQLGWQQRDFGGVTATGARMAVAGILDDRWYARFDADQANIKIKDSGTFDLAKEDYVRLALNRQLSNGSLDLSINHSQSNVQSRTGAAIARNWQLTQKSSLSLGYNWKDRTDSSGLMYALGQKNSVSLRGYQQITARDSFIWGLESSEYETRYNDKLGSGKAFDVQLAHSIFFEHPTWLVKAGFDYQKNNLQQKTLNKLPLYRDPVDQERLTTNSLLVDKYQYAYIGTSLQRGTPGALNRTQAQYTWMLDGVVGKQWPNNKITYSMSAGLGVEVFGDDELAVNLSYQSAPKSQFESKPGTTLGVSYSLRFGR